MTRSTIFTSLLLLLAPGLAMAHPGHVESSLLSGLGHPLAGLFHQLTSRL